MENLVNVSLKPETVVVCHDELKKWHSDPNNILKKEPGWVVVVREIAKQTTRD